MFLFYRTTTTPSNPADLISIDIARRNLESRSNFINEKKLHFGHAKTPKTVKGEEKHSKVITEEDLYKSKGPALQLKNIDPSSLEKNFSYETSEEEESESHAQTPASVAPVKRPSRLQYHDIGYEEFQPENVNFITRVPQNDEDAPSEPPSSRRHKQGNSCGCAKNLIVDLSQATSNNQRQRQRHSSSAIVLPGGYQFTS